MSEIPIFISTHKLFHLIFSFHPVEEGKWKSGSLGIQQLDNVRLPQILSIIQQANLKRKNNRNQNKKQQKKSHIYYIPDFYSIYMIYKIT